MGVTNQSKKAGAPRSSRLGRYLGVFGLLMLAAGPAPGAPADATIVRDLYYREILFQYYQEDYFSALTHLLAAQQQGRIERDHSDTELLRVGIELSYGLHADALEVFKRTLAGGVDQTARDRIWLALAKIWLRRGYVDRAADALDQIGNGLGREGRAEQALLQSRILTLRKHYAEAAAVLAAVPQVAPEWSPYLRYNQAVALQQAGQQSAGMALLDEIGRMKGDDQEQLALRDKANLTLGFIYLGGDQSAAAKETLGRIRLDSPFSTQALLGLGWAEYGLGNVSQALNSWSELQGRGLKDAAVQEASAMIPFAQWQLHAYQDAVRKYRDVISAYDAELTQLDALTAQTEQGTLIPDMAAVDGADLDTLPARIADADTRPYLLALLASDRFREAFTTYRNLRAQQRQLDARMADMAAYSDMLATRRYAYESHLPQVQARLQGMDWRTLENTVQGYAGRVEAIAAKQDAYALENAREQRQMKQIEQIETRLARWPQAHELDTQRTRLRVLKGLLRWQIESDYVPRLWETRKGVNALQQELGTAAEQRSRLVQAQVESPKRFEGYDARIAELRTRIAGLQQRLAAAVSQHERFLEALVREELDRHKRELQTYRLEASYALARLRDEIATGAEGK